MAEDIEQRAAEQDLSAGRAALARGRIESAAESLTVAESRFRGLGMTERAGDARLALGEAQAQNGAFEQAQSSYERAITYYKDAGAPLSEGAATVALGHLLRQRGKIDDAWQRYFLALKLYEKAGDQRGQASALVALGHVERLRGRYTKAADDYAQARALADQRGDAVSEADAARGQGEMLTAAGAFDSASEALARALERYHVAHDHYGAIDAMVSLGRLDLEQGATQVAAARFGEAIEAAGLVEYELGEADGELGVAETHLREGRLEQALAGAVKAGAAYASSHAAPGGADVNRLLGEINLQRGQLAQSVSLFERAMRAYKTLRAQAPYLRAALGAAESNRRRAQPRKATDLFTEARGLAQEIGQPAFEATAILGLGRIARAQGDHNAGALLDDASRRYRDLRRSLDEASASCERARLDLAHGKLDAATRLIHQARRLTHKKSPLDTRAAEATVFAVWSEVAVTSGQFDEARAHAHEALVLAEAAGDNEARIAATLSGAEADLRADNLQAAVNGFNSAANLAQAREATVADISASVGLARVLLRRGLWEEAATALHEALPRLRAAGEAPGQIVAGICLAEARRRLNERDAAREVLAGALRAARAAEYPLLEADALAEEGRWLRDGGEAEAASGRFTAAIALVKRVASGIKDVGSRAIFYDGYANLYAEALTALAAEPATTEVATLAENYEMAATGAGRATVAQYLANAARSLAVSGKGQPESHRRQLDEQIALMDSARVILTR